MKTVTEWFVSKKPVHVGVYEVRPPSYYIAPWFSKWDGELWLMTSRRVDNAGAAIVVSMHTEHLEWRGLAEKS